MTRALERRITCLERIQTLLADPPLLILCEPGESKEATIRRVCGAAGLPCAGAQGCATLDPSGSRAELTSCLC